MKTLCKTLCRLTALAAFLLLPALTALADGPLKIYYLRHGEGGHNVVKDWKDKPKAEWPDYVGNSDMFTPKGESQVAAAVEKLKSLQFDFIAVSPAWRTRNTVLPYLKLTGLKGEIWPELIEMRAIPPERIIDANLPTPGGKLLAGSAVTIPQDEVAYFNLREDGAKMPRTGKGEAQAMSDTIELGRMAIKLLKERFAGSGKSILLVGHGNSGSTLLRLLTGTMKFKGLENAKVWMAEEQPDGSFKLMMLNNEPFNSK